MVHIPLYLPAIGPAPSGNGRRATPAFCVSSIEESDDFVNGSLGVLFAKKAFVIEKKNDPNDDGGNRCFDIPVRSNSHADGCYAPEAGSRS